MKTKVYAMLVALLAMASSVFAQQDPSKGLTQYKLDNGLTVFLWEDHNQPDVHGRIVTRAGALDEPADYTGLAHYLEHVLFKGTKNIGALDWSKEKPLYEEIIKLLKLLKPSTKNQWKLPNLVLLMISQI